MLINDEEFEARGISTFFDKKKYIVEILNIRLCRIQFQDSRNYIYGSCF